MILPNIQSYVVKDENGIVQTDQGWELQTQGGAVTWETPNYIPGSSITADATTDSINVLCTTGSLQSGWKIIYTLSAIYVNSPQYGGAMSTICGFQPGRTYVFCADDPTYWWNQYPGPNPNNPSYPESIQTENLTGNDPYSGDFQEQGGKDDAQIYNNNYYMFTYFTPSDTKYAIELPINSQGTGNETYPTNWPNYVTPTYNQDL